MGLRVEVGTFTGFRYLREFLEGTGPGMIQSELESNVCRVQGKGKEFLYVIPDRLPARCRAACLFHESLLLEPENAIIDPGVMGTGGRPRAEADAMDPLLVDVQIERHTRLP